MPKEIYTLVRHPDLVAETRRAGEAPGLEGFDGGKRVDENGYLLDRILVKGYLILPRLSEEYGRIALFSLARGLELEPGEPPVFWVSGRVAGVCPGIFLDFQYDSTMSSFFAGTNLGGATSEPTYVAVGAAPPDLYTGRVLHVFVIIERKGLHVLVEDPFSEGVAVYGEGVSVRPGSARPWDGPPGGDWFVRVGPAHVDPFWELPAGFGLSDLQITFLGPCGEGHRILQYGGALDHLVAPDSPQPPATAHRVLRSISRNLRGTATDLETFADCLGAIRGGGDAARKRSFKELWF